MGLLNNLFQSGKSCNKHQPVSEQFSLSEENIRVALFRECEFKGRKLLFDTEKSLKQDESQQDSPTKTPPSQSVKSFPNNQLAEMVFGSVAMGFHSNCLKIHTLQSFAHLMLTQVFPSPRYRETKVRDSASSNSSQCLEQSAIFEDSATSSTNSSASDQLSTYSSTSDHILGDSLSSLSSGNVYKKWLRSNNCLTNNSGSSFGSHKECLSISSHHRSSKLGFVLIINLDEEEAGKFIQFCMEHIHFLESILHRSRRLIEIAYTKPLNFELAMVEIARLSAQGLRNLVSSPNLARDCDKSSIAFSSSVTLNNGFLSKLLDDIFKKRNTHSLTDNFRFRCANDAVATCDSKLGHFEKFVNEFCQLLEASDNKNTSFFMSSLVTAVLTHHLGWVTSTLPNHAEVAQVVNALQKQLMNLYGCIGHPRKMAQTIVTGNCQETLVKVLNCLTYFIKCCDIENFEMFRCNLEEESEIIKRTYEKYYQQDDTPDAIRKDLNYENAKNIKSNVTKKSFQNINKDRLSVSGSVAKRGLSRTKTFSNNLVSMENTKPEELFLKDYYDSSINNNIESFLADTMTFKTEICNEIEQEYQENPETDIVFVLGENEQLVGINKKQNNSDQNSNLIHSNIITNPTNHETVSVKEVEQNNNICDKNRMRIINLPMPKSTKKLKETKAAQNIFSIFKGVSTHYMPDMIVQGTISPKPDWIYKLKNDLALTSQHTNFGQSVEEVVAIIANIDKWEVHLMSSHTYVIDPNVTGIRIYMSQMIANMLESLYIMWKLKIPTIHCKKHMENKFQEICIRSKTVSQMLLKTPFCSMDVLNSTLNLDVNDVPLLMAIASYHMPEVTQKYGLSFQ